MKILLVAATEIEFGGLPKLVNQGETNVKLRVDLQFDFLAVGAGILSSGARLSQALALQNYDFVIHIGICGTLDRNLELGQVVHVTRDELADFGAEDHDRFISAHELGLVSDQENILYGSPWPQDLGYFKSEVEKLARVAGITVNTVNGNASHIDTLRLRLPHAQIESMEGAAVFYVCQLYQTPCVQFRAISNAVEPRNRATWKIKEAISALNDFLLPLFSN